MPTYTYRARSADGTPRQGTLTVANEQELLRQLEAQSLTPIQVELRRGGAGGTAPGMSTEVRHLLQRWQTGTKPINVMLFTRQLATMQAAGLPLVRAIRSISRDLSDKAFKKMLTRVANEVEGGRPLSEALSEFPGAFDEVYCRLVYTGEVSGTLDLLLKQMAEYLEKAEALRVRVQAALRYPTFVVIFLGVVMTIIFLKIIPEFAAIYKGLKVDLPIQTRILLAISDTILGNLFVVVLVVLGAFVAFSVFGLTRTGRLFYDTVKLKVPIFGELLRLHVSSRFTRTLGILSSSGTQILTALKVAAPVPGNARVEAGILEAKNLVESGRPLSSALEEVKVFPDLVTQMIATGEESGKLDEMLRLTAEYYEQRVGAALEGFASLIEPILIVILGTVVGAILFALYMPIFKIGQAIQGHQ
jgi:type IV pilus assembly protein PilC